MKPQIVLWTFPIMKLKNSLGLWHDNFRMWNIRSHILWVELNGTSSCVERYLCFCVGFMSVEISNQFAFILNLNKFDIRDFLSCRNIFFFFANWNRLFGKFVCLCVYVCTSSHRPKLLTSPSKWKILCDIRREADDLQYMFTQNGP